MGEKGMHAMTDMNMGLPRNTLPMMAGQGQFGPVGMGGMFTLLKVRDEPAAGLRRGPRSLRVSAGDGGGSGRRGRKNPRSQPPPDQGKGVGQNADGDVHADGRPNRCTPA